MPSTVEHLDVAEMRDQHDPDTPLFNALVAEYDAEVIDDLGKRWPHGQLDPEPAETPGQDPEPKEVGTEETGDTTEPVPDPAPVAAK
ncbi:hypothetical protein [Amycolatopsis minnesotensis]|uniref:Uncharacterized protein n=1 Tax=Amycolatopsis minnesotensis TaxID=337894 RepID=A0ABN2R1S9_9PSEU